MTESFIPQDEELRLLAIKKYELLDSMPEERYDNITKIVAAICDAPISLITLTDKHRNFIKSSFGIDKLTESPREVSFCTHAILQDDIMIVNNALKDFRFLNNPIVLENNIIFYAGVPLVDSNGFKLGTLCVYDYHERTLSYDQQQALKAMAKQVIILFEERLKNKELEILATTLQHRNEELNNFAGIVSHDLKAPLSNIKMIGTLLKSESSIKDNDEVQQYMEYLDEACNSMSTYIDGMLVFYSTEELTNGDYTEFSFVDLMEDIITLCVPNDHVTVNYDPQLDITLYNSEVALEQIFINLITNSIKYSDKEHTVIDVKLEEFSRHYEICFTDNGQGIPEDKLGSIFNLFTIAAEEDKFGKKGTGIGLATVSKIINQLGGSITVESILGEGTTFCVTLLKNEKV